jgi:hypothetical protein
MKGVNKLVACRRILEGGGEAVILSSNTVPGAYIKGLQRLELIAGFESLFGVVEESLRLEIPRISPVVCTMVC